MKNVVVKDTHLTFGGVAYFRGHAEEVQIGSVGELRKPGSKINYLEVKDRLIVPGEVIAEVTEADIDFENSSKTAFGVKVKALIKGIPADLTGDATFEKLKSGTLKLMKFSVLNNELRKILNNSPDILKDLNYWGKDARLAHQVFVIIQAELADQFLKSWSGKVSLGVKGMEAEVGVEGSSTGKTKVVISKDTCFAYLLLKINWDKKSTDLRIADMDDDQWGAG